MTNPAEMTDTEAAEILESASPLVYGPVIAEAMQHAAKRLREMQWQSIESAPKDGTWVLLREKYNDVPMVGQYLEAPLNKGHWIASHEHVDAEGGWDGAVVVDDFEEKNLTHWMPLPAPPVEQGE